MFLCLHKTMQGRNCAAFAADPVAHCNAPACHRFSAQHSDLRARVFVPQAGPVPIPDRCAAFVLPNPFVGAARIARRPPRTCAFNWPDGCSQAAPSAGLPIHPARAPAFRFRCPTLNADANKPCCRFMNVCTFDPNLLRPPCRAPGVKADTRTIPSVPCHSEGKH